MANGEEIKVTEETTSPEANRNTLAAVAAGVLVVIAGFLVYNYFARAGENPTENQQATKEELSLPNPDELTGEQSNTTTNDQQTAEKTEESATIETQTPAPSETPQDTSVQSTTPTTQETVAVPAVAGAWTVNDLQPNTVNESTYTVKSGDTLWEISEARYGSGFEWTKVLNANKDKVGFLNDGSQALIQTGQTLTLPAP